jgi:hypothetical protein
MATFTIPFVFSPEELQRQFQLATVDAVLDKFLGGLAPAITSEMIAQMVDSALRDPGYNLTLSVERSAGRSVHLDNMDVPAILSDVRMTFREMERVDDKPHALALVVVQIATRWDISVELLLNKLCQRLTRLLFAAAILPPINLLGEPSASLAPAEISFSVTTGGPATFDATASGISRQLTALLEMQITIEAKYNVTVQGGNSAAKQ